MESTISSTQLDFEIEAGSTLYATTELAKGTTIGGAVTIAGDITASSGSGVTALEQDMLVTEGTTLDKYTTLGKDTVVTTQFTSTSTGSTVVYSVGSTLANAVILSRDITLSSNMTLAYDAAAANNTQIKAGSVLANGSTMGAEFEIGVTYNTDTAGTQTITAATALTDTLYLHSTDSSATVTWGTSGATAVIKAGSLLTDGSVLTLSTSAADTTWDGPTLVTSAGVLEVGDTFTYGASITLSGDQVLSADLTSGNGG
ncbi:MAG: hypothetical protein GY809_17875, partial [Planctomycetes bacterium]|nr:hypothetical protein [Planctomycetota bacterium]